MSLRQTGTEQKRLRIIGDEEVDEIYGRPFFTQEERRNYFFLSLTEKELLQTLRSVKSQAYFVLQLGYFKAKQLFFKFAFHEVEEDLRYVLTQHFNGYAIADQTPINKLTRLNQQRMILELTNYRTCNAKERQRLELKACAMAMVCGKPIYIFREIIHYLSKQHIVFPSYNFMQDTVGKALTYEDNRLTSIMQDYLEPFHIEALKKLLQDSSGLYEITQLKHEPKDFSAGEIKSEIQRGKRIQPLYQLVQRLLPKLGISNESVKYYASLVDYYSVFRLKQLTNEWVVYVYLLCFVYYRYQLVNDNLINTLIYNIRHYNAEAKDIAKERVYECHMEINQNLNKAGQVLKLFTDDGIAASTPFHDVQTKAFSILERQKLVSIADQIAQNANFDETAFQWEHIDMLSRQFKRHLRPILLTVDFASHIANDPLIEAIGFLKTAFLKGRALGQYSPDILPKQFIPDSSKRYIYEQKIPLVDRYEFLVYRRLRNGLEAGDIFCRDSVRFRSFEDDLLNDQKWQNKETLIADIGLSILNRPIQEHLAELEQRLEDRIEEVNRRIISGENKHIKIKKHSGHSRWTLQYPHVSEPVNHSFFDKLKPIEIGTILHFLNQQCHFIDAFEHRLGRYSKQVKNDHTVIACLIAWGTNMGLGRMGEISDIGYSQLAVTSDNFIRLETLKEANDHISNAISKLPLFRYYDIDEVIHSSSDGQKFETRTNTINSRHSPKYFGLRKGIVSYGLVTNHIPVNAQIIGANEHESHYVFDLLFNNNTDIQSSIHSTDSHGTNEANSFILYIFGYLFAPRYRDIYDVVSRSLCGFKHQTQYDEGLIIKPARKINTALIVEEWENIQRICVSLALKTTTQSIIVGKLSSHARKNKTKRALWEFDAIIKSLFLLDYIDSPQLRQNIQRALNRGESYHKLRRAVSYANFGKLRFKTEQEQQIWDECSRLLSNCIIYYNISILSKLLAYKESIGDFSGADILKMISPVAWQHINLFGRYEFNMHKVFINMEAIIHELAHLVISSQPTPVV